MKAILIAQLKAIGGCLRFALSVNYNAEFNANQHLAITELHLSLNLLFRTCTIYRAYIVYSES
jgi:hypothetical protein